MAALFVCVIAGGIFWVGNQRSDTGPAVAYGPAAQTGLAPLPAATTAEVESAAIQFERITKVIQSTPTEDRPAETVALIKTGQDSWASAKKALEKGDNVAARQHLLQVRMSTNALTRQSNLRKRKS